MGKKVLFVKIYSDFISASSRLSKSQLLTFLWFAIHADSRGNIVWLTPELMERLLKFVGIKRNSMYNVINFLERKELISKHGNMVMVNSTMANKHRKINVELTPYNWSLTELDY